MTSSAKRHAVGEQDPVRVLGRGLRAQRGVRLTIRTLREAVGRTQADVAEVSEIDQGDVSRLEGRASFDDCQVSTLRRYIEALGGELDLVASFGDKRIIIAGSDAPAGDESPRRQPPRRASRARSK